MSNYRNEDGEYLMSAAEIALEDALDAQSREEDEWERQYDDYDYDPEPLDPFECAHRNGSDPEDAGFECDDCEALLQGPRWEWVGQWGIKWESFFSREMPMA